MPVVEGNKPDHQLQRASAKKNDNKPQLISPVDRSLRAYSKKHRVYIFREFILQTYGNYLFGRRQFTQQQPSINSVMKNEKIIANAPSHNEHNRFTAPTSQDKDDDEIIVLDIAGGKGDLSWLLTHVDNIRSVVIDPRPTGTNNHIQRSVNFLLDNPMECQIRANKDQCTYQPIASLMPQLLPKLMSNKNALHKAENLKLYVNQELVDAVRSVIQIFGNGSKEVCLKKLQNGEGRKEECPTIWNSYWNKLLSFHNNGNTNNNNDIDDHYVVSHCQKALEIILKARLIVGFHPDQATDSCIDLAKVLNVPWAIVPCCVYPSEFPHRRIWYRKVDDDDDDDNYNNEKKNDEIEPLLFCQPIIQPDHHLLDPTGGYNITNDNGIVYESTSTTLLNSISSSSSSAYSYQPVKRYNELLLYLHQKNYPDKIQTNILPFEGTTTAKNIVLYTLPP